MIKRYSFGDGRIFESESGPLIYVDDYFALLEAAKDYMDECPADYDATKQFKAASLKLEAAIAKAEGK